METVIIVIGIIIYLVINLGFAKIICESNKKLLFGRIFLACLILSPIFGALIAIIDILSQNVKDEKKKCKKEEKTDNYNPIKLNDNELYVEKGKKRIKIYDSEKEDYIKDGWCVVE